MPGIRRTTLGQRAAHNAPRRSAISRHLFAACHLLPFEAAERLRDLLVEYAADARDYSVSGSFVVLLRTRKAA
jgi:hypothetical protein